ncbi:MAG: PIN domain-containing protein [Candidatus Eremiobacterota bacterium]
MTDEVVVDTNVLVYAYGGGDQRKQTIALATLDRLVRTKRCVLPAQVLAEFFVVSRKKCVPPLTNAQAHERLEVLSQVCRVLDLTGLGVQEAARGVLSHSLSYWDAQIWAVARLNQIPLILSEDFSHGSTLGGVGFLNPFHADFELASL